MTITTIFLSVAGIFGVYALYRNNVKLHVLILCSIGIIGFVLLINRMENRNQKRVNTRFENLYEEGQLTIGKVVGFGYNRNGNASTKSSVRFIYIIENNTEINNSNGTLLPDFFEKKRRSIWRSNFNKTKKNELYPVLYDKNNPEESILLLESPIINDKEFEVFKKKFNEDRKK